ncbi:MAG: hypothetical protein VYD75_10085 [Pseudomonadota bacterium]|nr:hypothetical protein [Pseudomonadota bacterium]
MEKQYTINNKKYKLFEGCFYKITKDDSVKQLTQDEFLFTLYTEDNDYIGQGYERVINDDGLQIFNNSYDIDTYGEEDRGLGTLVYVNTLAQNFINMRETLCDEGNFEDVRVLDEYYETETHGRLTK